MPSTVEQLSPTRVKITVEVPFADLKPSVDKAYRDIAQSINIPGFRKGKVPPLVIDQRFGRGAILQEALNEALPRFYGAAVAENKLSPLAQPEVEVTKLEDGDLVEFVAEVDVRPDFDLPAVGQSAGRGGTGRGDRRAESTRSSRRCGIDSAPARPSTGRRRPETW